MRGRLAVLVVVLVALGVMGAPVAGAAATAGGGGKVFIKASIDTNELTVRPHALLLSGDGTLSLYGIHYESYGGPVAKATGHAYTRGCTPDCAQGKVKRPRATIRFSELLKCEGQLVYGQLNYVLRGPVLKGYRRQGSFDLRPLDEETGKPAC